LERFHKPFRSCSESVNRFFEEKLQLDAVGRSQVQRGAVVLPGRGYSAKKRCYCAPMPIKFRAKSKDEIPADLQSLYVERDGAFVLDVEGAVDKSRVDEVRAGNVALANAECVYCLTSLKRGVNERHLLPFRTGCVTHRAQTRGCNGGRLR
jgi:hypothetical protein